MPDLTIQQLSFKLPAGSVIVDDPNSDIKISLKALMGEVEVALDDAKVAEILSKLLDGASQAQTAYNADAANPNDLTSYPNPTAGVATRDPNGNWFTTMTHTVTVRVPLDRASTTANSV